jgi:ABC-type transport system involved in cytochrome c biogenesis permease subunit
MLILSLSFACYLFSIWKIPLLYFGLVLQVSYLVSRGFELGRLPLVGMHDTLAFMTAALVAFSIPFSINLRERLRFQTIVAVLAAVFTVFVLTSKQHNAPLPPVLKTLWFEAHVVLAFLSYGLFGIGAVLGYLNLTGREETHEWMLYRALLIRYCLFTLSMIFGGIWAYLAWGTYWLWTPKELWTSILWLYYSFFLHARLRQWWMGRPLSCLGIIGFAVVLFTYLGVSILMKSSHSF